MITTLVIEKSEIKHFSEVWSDVKDLFRGVSHSGQEIRIRNNKEEVSAIKSLLQDEMIQYQINPAD